MTYPVLPSRHSRPRLRAESIKSYLRLVLRSNGGANEGGFRPTGTAYGAFLGAENFIRIFSVWNSPSARPLKCVSSPSEKGSGKITISRTVQQSAEKRKQ